MRKALLILIFLFGIFLTIGYAESVQIQTALPVANFSSNLTSGYTPLSVQFTDLSKDATEWNWDFGDGTTSTEQNPAHVYSLASTYTVSLTVSNPNGTDSMFAMITVLEVHPVGSAIEESVEEETNGEESVGEESIGEESVEEESVEEEELEEVTPVVEESVEGVTPVEEITPVVEESVEGVTPVDKVTPAEEDYLEKYLKEYEQEGKIEFNTPEKMKVGESEVFTAYITRNTSESILKEIELDETFQSKNITVTPEMKVTLIGSGEGTFIIDPLTDDVQPIIGQRTTTWKWSVTPQKSGKQNLILNVYLVIPSDSGKPRYVDELKNEIKVGVNPSYFFGKNWQWLIGTIVTILLALLGMYAKNKSK